MLAKNSTLILILDGHIILQMVKSELKNKTKNASDVKKQQRLQVVQFINLYNNIRFKGKYFLESLENFVDYVKNRKYFFTMPFN